MKVCKQSNILVLRDVVFFPGMIGSLLVGRKVSLSAIKKSIEGDQEIVLLLQKTVEEENPKVGDLCSVGVMAKILQHIKLPNGSVKILVEARYRVGVKGIELGDGFSGAAIEYVNSGLDDLVNQVYLKNIRETFILYSQVSLFNNKKVLILLSSINDSGRYADIVLSHLDMTIEDKQAFLEINNDAELIKRTSQEIIKKIEWLKVEKELKLSIKLDIDADKAAYVKEKKVKALKRIIGGSVLDNTEPADGLLVALKKLPIDKSVKSKLLSDYNKLKLMPAAAAEATVIRSHLEWVVDIPWSKSSKVNSDLAKAKLILDRDHFGLKDVKARVLEHLAVYIKSKQKAKGAILCFVGAPGVGKTSLCKSIAEAMGREYVRIALGGVRDEAEIRGHRKTYIGAMPGRIIKAMKRSKVVNPLILLDEIDKIGMDFRGDPASALLEVLDPEQNHNFNDHYLELDYDLSKVIFIATANTLDIPDALLDRMEIIELSSYSEEEKLKIAKKYLVGKCMKSSGLIAKEFSISDAAILEVIRGYTREAGVRLLEKALAKICRKVVYCFVKKSSKKKVFRVSTNSVAKLLGVRQFNEGDVILDGRVGLVYGMAWTSAGGVLLAIESSVIVGKGKFIYTGSLGDVMQESMQAALTVVKSMAHEFKIDLKELNDLDIHIHVPEGATPKDGPSAGCAICIGILSVLAKRVVRGGVAITGEITLRGDLIKIGGLKEKLLAAMRSGVTTAIIPQANEVDLLEIKPLLKNKLKVVACKHVSEVIDLIII